MKRKETATLAEHAKLALRTTRIEVELMGLMRDCSRILPKAQARRIASAMKAISCLKSALEDEMFSSYKLPIEWGGLYYGGDLDLDALLELLDGRR